MRSKSKSPTASWRPADPWQTPAPTASPFRGERAGVRGFTLLELMLVLGLLLMLASLAVVNVNALMRGSELEEGARRFETMIRFARAHAANTGRRVRLSFQQTGAASPGPASAPRQPLAEVRAQWEPEPVTEPGAYTELIVPAWARQAPNELVGVERVEPLDQAADEQQFQALDEVEQEQEAIDLPPLTFYPDGSCESRRIVLASRDPDDPRRAIIEVDGITGTIRRHLRQPDELTEQEAGTDGAGS